MLMAVGTMFTSSCSDGSSGSADSTKYPSPGIAVITDINAIDGRTDIVRYDYKQDSKEWNYSGQFNAPNGLFKLNDSVMFTVPVAVEEDAKIDDPIE